MVQWRQFERLAALVLYKIWTAGHFVFYCWTHVGMVFFAITFLFLGMRGPWRKPPLRWIQVQIGNPPRFQLVLLRMHFRHLFRARNGRVQEVVHLYGGAEVYGLSVHKFL